MSTETRELSLPALLRRARQCVSLTTIVRASQDSIDDSESCIAEIVSIAGEIAEQLYRHFLHTVGGGDTAVTAFGVAGKLDATLAAAAELALRIEATSDDDARDRLNNRVGWLRNAADDLAIELAKLVDQMSVEGGAA